MSWHFVETTTGIRVPIVGSTRLLKTSNSNNGKNTATKRINQIDSERADKISDFNLKAFSNLQVLGSGLQCIYTELAAWAYGS